MSATAVQLSQQTTTLAAGQVAYAALASGCLPIPVTAEASQQMPYRTAQSFFGLYAFLSQNATTGASTIKTRKNGADGAQAVSIGAAATGEFQDVFSQDSVVAGDLMDYQITSGGGGTLTLRNLGVVAWQDTAGAVAIKQAAIPAGNGQAFTAASTTNYIVLAGQVGVVTVEANNQTIIRETATLKSMAVSISGNARTTATTLRSRKNAANGALSVSVGSTATGIFEDTTNSDSLVSGDLLAWQIVTGTGTQTLTLQYVAGALSSTAGVVTYASGATGGIVRNAATSGWLALQGRLAVAQAEANTNAQALAAGTFSNLWLRISANGCNGASTFTLRADSGAAAGTMADTALSVSVGASTTGAFEDTTHSVAVASAARKLDYTFTVAGSTGTVTLNVISAKFTASYAQLDATASSPNVLVATSSQSWTHVVSNRPSRLLLVAVFINAVGGTVSSVTYGGTNLTFLAASTNGADRVEYWSLVAPATGSATVTINLSGSILNDAASVSYYGVDQTNPIEATAAYSGALSAPSGIIETETAGSLVQDVVAGTVPGAGSPGSAQDQDVNQTNSTLSLTAVGSLALGTGTAQTLSWGTSTTTWAQLLAVIRFSGEAQLYSGEATMTFSGVEVRSASRAAGSVALVGSGANTRQASRSSGTGLSAVAGVSQRVASASTGNGSVAGSGTQQRAAPRDAGGIGSVLTGAATRQATSSTGSIGTVLSGVQQRDALRDATAVALVASGVGTAAPRDLGAQGFQMAAQRLREALSSTGAGAVSVQGTVSGLILTGAGAGNFTLAGVASRAALQNAGTLGAALGGSTARQALADAASGTFVLTGTGPGGFADSSAVLLLGASAPSREALAAAGVLTFLIGAQEAAGEEQSGAGSFLITGTGAAILRATGSAPFLIAGASARAAARGSGNEQTELAGSSATVGFRDRGDMQASLDGVLSQENMRGGGAALGSFGGFPRRAGLGASGAGSVLITPAGRSGVRAAAAQSVALAALARAAIRDARAVLFIVAATGRQAIERDILLQAQHPRSRWRSDGPEEQWVAENARGRWSNDGPESRFAVAGPRKRFASREPES